MLNYNISDFQKKPTPPSIDVMSGYFVLNVHWDEKVVEGRALDPSRPNGDREYTVIGKKRPMLVLFKIKDQVATLKQRTVKRGHLSKIDREKNHIFNDGKADRCIELECPVYYHRKLFSPKDKLRSGLSREVTQDVLTKLKKTLPPHQYQLMMDQMMRKLSSRPI
jgi:hypothetical protein